jgi:hypothetical protein
MSFSKSIFDQEKMVKFVDFKKFVEYGVKGAAGLYGVDLDFNANILIEPIAGDSVSVNILKKMLSIGLLVETTITSKANPLFKAVAYIVVTHKGIEIELGGFGTDRAPLNDATFSLFMFNALLSEVAA